MAKWSKATMGGLRLSSGPTGLRRAVLYFREIFPVIGKPLLLTAGLLP